MDIEVKIREVLETQVNPILGQHLGGAVLTRYENNIAMVRMTGACATCPSAQDTIEDVIREKVMENCKEVKDVVLDTSVSEDLMAMAKKILNKEI